MFFIILTFFAALFIEGLGSLVSVIGISALFGANPIIIALAIALDVGKVVTVSLLYTYWRDLSKLMKTYALLAATVTMIITSAGAAGYLTGEFQKSIMATREGDLKVAVLKDQQAKYELRKKQIDDQIAALPERTTVTQRLRLVRAFQAEQKSLDARIAEIDKSLPELQVAQIGTEAKAGPIVSISKAFGIPMEEAVSWVIGMIIFVFDPLAIFLIIAGNFLWARRKAELAAKAPASRGEIQEDVDPGNAAERMRAANEYFDENTPRASTSEEVKELLQQFTPMEGTRSEYLLDDFPKDPVKDQVFFHDHMRQMYIFDGEHWVGANTLATSAPEEIEIQGETSPEEMFTMMEAEEARKNERPADAPVETTYEKFEAPVAVEPIVVEVEPAVKEEQVVEEEERPSYHQSGLLKPVKVELPEVVVETNRSDFIPMRVEPTAAEPEPVEPQAPRRREEITRSTLGLVNPDPNTIVDANRVPGFRRAESKK